MNRSERIIKHHRDPLTPAAEAAAGSYSSHLLGAIDWAIRFHGNSRPQCVSEWRQALAGESAPPLTCADGVEAPTAVAGSANRTAENVDLLLEPTARSQAAKSEVLAREKPKRRKRYWIAGLAALLIVFIGLSAHKEGSSAAPEAGNTSESAVPSPIPAPQSYETDGVTPAPIENLAAASPGQAQPDDAHASVRNAPPTPQSDRETIAPVTLKAPAEMAFKETQIARLLEQARTDFDQLRLSTPPGNNALEKYRQVHALDGQNQEAKDGVRRIVETYARLGKQAAQRKDYDRASFFIDQALAIATDSNLPRRAQRRLKRKKRRRP